MSAIIYNRQGYRIFTTPINKGSKAKFTLMQEDYVTLVFSSDAPIPFSLGDNYTNRDLGKRYEIIDLPNPKYNKNTGGYDYELRMDAYYWKWRNKIFKYFNLNPDGTTTSKETSWNITATIDVIMGVFIRNLNDYYYKYYAGGQSFIYDLSTLENASEAKLVTFDNTNMIDALNAIAEAWQCEWWITNNIIHFGKCEYGDNYVPLHTLANGDAIANVDEMSQSGNRATYATRIFAYGSDRNLPYNYRQTENNDVVNAVVQKRLMLPKDKPYIDAYRYVSGERVYIGEPGYENGTEMPQEEAIEGSITIDSVYPRSTVAITEVHTDEITDTIVNEDGSETTEKWTRYRIKLSFASQFKEKYILEGKTLRISFESGLLNGMDFDVAFNPDKADEDSADSQWFEIKRNEDYGRKLPDDVLMPEVGDSVVLYNWNIALMPTDDLGFIDKAENELYEEAAKEMKKMMIDPNNYTCKMMSDVMLGYDLKTHTANPDKALTLDVGQRVLLLNDAYFENGERKSRIIGYEYNLDLLWDSPTFIVGESASVGRLNALESKVENLTIKGIPSSGNGGGNNIYIIGSNDITKATDRNVYSALRTDKSFARKDMDDTIQEIWSFYKYLQSKGFNSGVLGSGWFLGHDLYNENGEGVNSHLEVDTIKVRKKAMFDSLEIKHISHVGGELILSPAGATISKVEEGTLFYRCHFRNDDGTDVTVNQFAVGDLVMCKTFNLDGGQRYYWRRCLRKGSFDGMAFVDLSKTVYDTTTTNDAPVEGDAIVVVGNVSDTARQNAIVISSYATGAPSISLYQGINTFELPESKMPVRISPTLGNKFTGDFYIQVGGEEGASTTMALAEFLENRISLSVTGLAEDLSNLETQIGSEIKLLEDQISLSVTGLAGLTEDLNELDSKIDSKVIELNNTIGDESAELRNYIDSEIKNCIIGENAVEETIMGPAPALGLVGYRYGRTYAVNEDVAKTWKVGDKVVFYFLFKPYTEDVSNLWIEGNGVLNYMFDTLDLSSAIGTGTETRIVSGVLTCNKTLDEAIAEAEANDEEIEFGVLISAQGTHAQGALLLGYLAALRRTGIDIENGRITLDAQTTTIKDGNKEIAVFTTNADGKAILSTELIDADEIAVNQLTTKGSSENGKKTKYININKGQMTAFDGDGNPKIHIHSGVLQSDSSSAEVSSTYLGTSNPLLKANNSLKIDVTKIFEVNDENLLFVFNAITVSMTLNLREYSHLESAGNSVSVKARLYYAENSIATMEAIEVLAEDKLSLFGVEVPSTQTKRFTLPINNYILAKGVYKIVLEFYTNVPHDDSSVVVYASPGLQGRKSTQMQEIATNGYHFSYGNAETPKYQKANSENFEIVYGKWGLRISAEGIQYSKNGGSTWLKLIQ